MIIVAIYTPKNGVGRSHSVFTITIEQTDLGDDSNETLILSRLNLVDLAGDKRVCILSLCNPTRLL